MDLELRNQTTGSLSTARMKVEVVSLLFAECCNHGKCVLYPLLISFQKERFLLQFFLSN